MSDIFFTDAVIAIHSVGICGTDIHIWHDRHLGDIVLDKPHIPGHETSGTVVKIGANVTNLKPGNINVNRILIVNRINELVVLFRCRRQSLSRACTSLLEL